VSAKPSTTRRWLARLIASAWVLTQALVESGEDAASVIRELGIGCSRRELVEGLAGAGVVDEQQKLGQLASWVHRVVPGLRVM
jgi:DNA-directed RNA polymerase subunit N (RpoN/RPB10)